MQVKQLYKNFYLAQPSDLSEEYAQGLLTPTIWTPSQKLAEIDRESSMCRHMTPDSEATVISGSDIERHRDELLSKVHLEVLVNGNIEKQVRGQILKIV